MKWGVMFGITVILLLITLYEWPKIEKNEKKEKAAFIAITALGGLLGVVLVFFPDLPGPTQLVNAIFSPLGKLLEK